MASQTEQQGITCPKCDSEDAVFSKKRQHYICLDCSHEFSIEIKISKRRIFLSYGDDEPMASVRGLIFSYLRWAFLRHSDSPVAISLEFARCTRFADNAQIYTSTLVYCKNTYFSTTKLQSDATSCWGAVP